MCIAPFPIHSSSRPYVFYGINGLTIYFCFIFFQRCCRNYCGPFSLMLLQNFDLSGSFIPLPVSGGHFSFRVLRLTPLNSAKKKFPQVWAISSSGWQFPVPGAVTLNFVLVFTNPWTNIFFCKIWGCFISIQTQIVSLPVPDSVQKARPYWASVIFSCKSSIAKPQARKTGQ